MVADPRCAGASRVEGGERAGLAGRLGAGRLGGGGVATPLRSRLIEHIAALNPTATPSVLELFDDASLTAYLERLERAREPRTCASEPWIRRGDTPAITKWCVLSA
jgi:hypothetical protein